MKPPSSLIVTDVQIGAGRKVVPGDVAVCRCRCTRRKGDLVFASADQEPYSIRVGARDCCVGIEYGLIGMQLGGKRMIQVPPNLTYVERKIYPDLPEDAMLIYELELVDLSTKWDAEMEHRLALKASESNDKSVAQRRQ